MVWKKKEVELHPREAIRLALEELEPYWFQSPPLFAAASHDGTVAIYPLSEVFAEKTWLLTFIDPYTLEGQSALDVAKIWFNRFRSNEITPLVVFCFRFSGHQELRSVRKLISRTQIRDILVVDHDGEIHKAFPSLSLPGVALIDRGKTLFTCSGESWIQKSEQNLVDFIRKRDPGFASEPVLKDKDLITPTLGSIEGKALLGLVHGPHEEDQGACLISDPTTRIEFETEHECIYILAESRHSENEKTKVSVEVNNGPVLEWFAGRDLGFDESGNGTLMVSEPRIHSMLLKGSPGKRKVKLTFPTSKRYPVALYSIIFSNH